MTTRGKDERKILISAPKLTLRKKRLVKKGNVIDSANHESSNLTSVVWWGKNFN